MKTFIYWNEYTYVRNITST